MVWLLSQFKKMSAPPFVQFMPVIDLLLCGFRANMCTTERENKTKNGGTHHEKYLCNEE